jgi:multidrug efflux system membrane fusion protein
MYPRKIFEGKVTAIGAGISRGRNISTKNTLPIVAESINWLRLFSRFPVFIQIKNNHPQYSFRVGATAVVIIHVK